MRAVITLALLGALAGLPAAGAGSGGHDQQRQPDAPVARRGRPCPARRRGTFIPDAATLGRLVRARRPDTSVDVTVVRRGAAPTLHITAEGQRPER